MEQQEAKQFSLELTLDQINHILSCLSEAPSPWKLTDPVIQAIRTQVIKQIQESEQNAESTPTE